MATRGRIYTLVLLFAFCKLDLEDKRQQLEEELGQGRAFETLSRIDLTIQEANRSRSREISGTTVRRKFYPSLNARTVVFVEGKTLFQLRLDREELVRLELPVAPVHLLLSGSGDAGVALTDAEPGNCRFIPLSFLHVKLYETFQQDCLNLPAISDQHILYTVGKENLSARRPGGAEPSDMLVDMPPEVPLNQFTAKYKKIKNKYVLFALPDNSLFLFFGKAGYYDLYHYPGFGTRARKILTDVARPTLNGEVPHLDIQSRTEARPEKKSGDLKLKPVKSETSYFVTRRRAGRFELVQLVQKKDTFTVRPGIRIKPTEQMTYLGNEQAFLQARRNLLAVWKPGKPYRYLPLISQNFAVYQGGILYEDYDGKLYHRQSGFEPTELELLKLKFDAENMAESDRAQQEAEKAHEAKEAQAHESLELEQE